MNNSNNNFDNNNLDKWNDNVNKLKQFKLEHPNLWQYMQKFVDIFNSQSNAYRVIDDHFADIMDNNLNSLIHTIGISYKLDKTTHVIATNNFWIFPFRSNIYTQCKNLMYISDNKIHVSIESKGCDLYTGDIYTLNQAKSMSWSMFFNNIIEETFVLPIYLFLESFDLTETDKTTEINKINETQLIDDIIVIDI